MAIDKEIERTVKKIADKNRHIIPISILEQEKIVSDAKNAYDSLIFNFGSITSLVLHQEGKKRLVKQYNDPYSPESILCQSIKQILDKVFKVKYPNRNKICRNLFSVLPATIQMSDFTIVKFDFQDFFNSISSIYVFEKYLRSKLLDRHDVDLIKKFVYSTKYAYAGLCTSNAIAEIIAKQFDNAVQQMFISNGIIYYERYIDDSILILNEHMEEAEVRIKLENILSNVFYDRNFNGLKCRTKYNNKKFRYICRRNILNTSCSVDFLGYEFWFSSKKNGNKNVEIKIKYGITAAKRKKYEDRIDRLIQCYTDPLSPDNNKLELLRHRIAAFSSREVYMTRYFQSTIWRVKGFISNYGELRFLLDTGLIEQDTEDYLKNMIDEAFKRAKIDKPYFLQGGGNTKCGYNLYGNMRSNKTILLVNHIGYDYKSLVALCNKIGIKNIDTTGKQRSYDTLVKDYLIKVKVGY